MDYSKKTGFALLTNSLLNEPITLLYVWIPFIMRKDLAASTFQITLFLMLRPVMSLFSFYWSFFIERRGGGLRSNLVIAGILARLPFLFCFFYDNVWFLLFSSAIHMLFLKGSIPAWMEIIKLNLPGEKRAKLFSLSSTIGYLEGILLAIGIGTYLDTDAETRKIFYLVSALLGLGGVLIQWSLPICGEKNSPPKLLTLAHPLLQPWKKSIELLRARPDFAHFQWGFMIGGFGIMLITAALPIFFVDVLQLSHSHFATARSICMGLGFALSANLWAKALNRFSISRLASFICCGFALFPLLLLCSSIHLMWLYIAYIVYGITQGGSHLVWHLSGPWFAKDENSSQYSEVNVCMLGVRGLVAPLVGNLLCWHFNPHIALLLGSCICIGGMCFMLRQKQYSTNLR